MNAQKTTNLLDAALLDAKSQPRERQPWFMCENVRTLSDTGRSVLGLDSLSDYHMIYCLP